MSTDTRYRHASGEGPLGCSACHEDADAQAISGVAESSVCTHPEPDPEEPGQCLFCSHTVERVA